MYPFWDVAIWPILQAAEARRIVEIGALRGDTTVRMLEELSPDTELYVIDPVPAFDPSEHEQQFPGRYVFHRDLSVNVLPHLPPVDVALIDGDHNWYTVYNELRLLADRAGSEGRPLPVFILHDVGWPYGRRDLYYAPDNIPEQYRHPFAQKGIVRGQSELSDRSGLNPRMHNATHEGGPRNGVMTAVDDFIAEQSEPMNLLVLPIYFGLAIVVDESRLERQPALADLLERLAGIETREELLELSESVRLQAMVFQHNNFYRAEKVHDRLARRYLDVVKAALLDEHYIENEVRLDHLARRYLQGASPDTASLRDPIRLMKPKLRKVRAARQSGEADNELNEIYSYFPYTTMGRVRLDHLEQCLDTVRAESVQGDLVECFTGRGGGGIFMRAYLDAYEMKKSAVFVVDPFGAVERGAETDDLPVPVPDTSAAPVSGADVEARDIDTELTAMLGGGRGFPDFRPDLNDVREGFARFDLLDKRVRFVQGDPATALLEAPIEKVALIRLGRAVGARADAVLESLYDKLTVGGIVVIEDYNDAACQQAVDAFRERRNITDEIDRVDWSARSWRKLGQTAPAVAVAPRPAAPAAVPLAPPPPSPSKDLSIIVVFYNMRREAERTLHSLSRSYQQGVDKLDYEVIAIENGSDDDQKLGDEFVRSFGPEFRYLDLGEAATPSPVDALNRGVEIAAGKNLTFMIDGAHVLTPGVLRFGMAGLRTYRPAIVATQQWYVGPGQQGDAMIDGYDQQFEDRLFDEIAWPSDGYRLFDIGHFIGERDWLDGLWESNCLFVPRQLVEQVGAFDERFSMPGGGYANLDLYERLGMTPDVTVTTILGEGSFHQVHGGTTTNMPDADARHRRLASYAGHFEEVRGRSFIGHRKPVHYVGSLSDESRRTRARRRVAPNFFKAGSPEGPDGRPAKPVPIPQELRAEFVDAYWRSLAWKQTSWLGIPVAKLPMDLFAYQEIVVDVRPDWIIETGSGSGGRALFLASVCDLIDHGQVLSLDLKERDRPQHPRITYLTGHPWLAETAEKVRDIVGDDPHAMVILGSQRNARRTRKEFDFYSPMVRVGSYVVIENTIYNGHPVWPGFGPGPAEAVKGVVEQRGDFVFDLKMDKYKFSFNPGGFLKRLS